MTATYTELWPIDKFVPYIRNPRKNDAAVDRMCASIREFGFKIPCLVRSDGEVVDGHLRLKAARRLGITEIRKRSRSSKPFTARRNGPPTPSPLGGFTRCPLRPFRRWGK